MEYRVELGIKNREKGEKRHILGIPGCCVPVHFEHVPVHLVFWSFLANMYRYILDMYRYTLFCFPSFDQFSYFGHNFLISYPI